MARSRMSGQNNPYAFATRYPGYVHQVNRNEVRAAIEIAEKVVAWAEAIVTSSPSQHGGQPPPPPAQPGGMGGTSI
jgi:hypothetical protein